MINCSKAAMGKSLFSCGLKESFISITGGRRSEHCERVNKYSTCRVSRRKERY